MGGGLMQLVAYGAQDIYLTGNPQITFFKVVYRRHTNFSMEHIQQTFKGTPGSGARVVATVSRNGDLIHDCYLKIDSDGTSGKNPGHNILDNVEVEIGGQSIDKQYGHFMEAHAELTEKSYGGFLSGAQNLDVGGTNLADISPFQYTAGAGGIDVATTSGGCNLYVPLRFWFCRHVGLSLPLIALQYHEVNFNVTFSTVYDTITTTTEPQLWVNYIYLDTDERRRFAQVSHEYLIEQIQTQEFSWSNAGGTQTLKLNFNHPVKELIWAATTGTGAGDNMNLGWGKDTVNGGSFADFALPAATMKLRLNGHDRFASQDVDYFTRYQPLEYHENLCRSAASDQIGVYSFALKPEEHQPSGTCNFSRIDSAEFELTLSKTAITTLQMYAINYNVLRIMSGMGGLAYSN
jgi:hypothetical protein